MPTTARHASSPTASSAWRRVQRTRGRAAQSSTAGAMTRSLTASPIHQVDQMGPKSVQRANPASERAATPAVALTAVLPSAARPASLKMSRARSQAVSATAGVAALSLAGFARWTDFGPIWSTWWMGDAVSDLVIAPAVLLWAARPRVRWTRRQALEAVGLLACLAVVGIAVFGELVPWKDKHYPLEFLCVPLLLWVAFRFEQRDAATVVVLLAGVAIWGTLRGYGPFARPLFNESLLLLQAFQGVSAVITLVLAAAVAERTEAVDRLRRLAVGDPPDRKSVG